MIDAELVAHKAGQQTESNNLAFLPDNRLCGALQSCQRAVWIFAVKGHEKRC